MSACTSCIGVASHEPPPTNFDSDHRFRRRAGCACTWCHPYPCDLCGLTHTLPETVEGCIEHFLSDAVATFTPERPAGGPDA